MLIVAKPTRHCNAACVYCSSEPTCRGQGPLKMDHSRLRLLMRRVEELLQKTPRVEILWHGGEPLLMGREFFITAKEMALEIEGRTGGHVGFQVQTNMTLLDDRMAKVLKEIVGLGQVSSSFDPVAGIRNLPKGSYNHRWLKAAEVAAKHDLHVGCVYVVHRESLGRAKEIYYFFRNIGYHMGVRFNPMYDAGQATMTSLHITPKEWGDFMVELYHIWNDEGRSISVAPLSEWDSTMSGRRYRLACAASGDCGTKIIGLDGTGDIYNCGRCLDDGILRWGNLADGPLEDVLGCEERIYLQNRGARLLQGDCKDCPWWDWCHGGCPNDAYLANKTIDAATCWCESQKMFFEEWARDHGWKV